MRSFFSAKQRPQLPPNRTLIKVALLGDEGVGKTSLMVRFIEGAFDQAPTFQLKASTSWSAQSRSAVKT